MSIPMLHCKLVCGFVTKGDAYSAGLTDDSACLVFLLVRRVIWAVLALEWAIEKERGQRERLGKEKRKYGDMGVDDLESGMLRGDGYWIERKTFFFEKRGPFLAEICLFRIQTLLQHKHMTKQIIFNLSLFSSVTVTLLMFFKNASNTC